ncbi:hypothetical protein [Terasakiella pusilla]|uniref:hypothetical protein n=1 Tax=Terasakiella pusilla TaxID=64973 RepID=UPI003AA7B4D2
MRLNEFSPEASSTFIYSIEFSRVPIQSHQLNDDTWPVVTVNASTCQTMSKSIDEKQPIRFVVRVVTFGNDISVINKHIRASEVRWCDQVFDGYECYPQLIGDVLEVKRMTNTSTETITHNLEKKMADIVARM